MHYEAKPENLWEILSRRASVRTKLCVYVCVEVDSNSTLVQCTMRITRLAYMSCTRPGHLEQLLSKEGTGQSRNGVQWWVGRAVAGMVQSLAEPKILPA